MENMTDKELCQFIKISIDSLTEQKKDEVMKCVGTFVRNEKIEELNKQINNFQKQCKHLILNPNGKCAYCGKTIQSVK